MSKFDAKNSNIDIIQALNRLIDMSNLLKDKNITVSQYKRYSLFFNTIKVSYYETCSD